MDRNEEYQVRKELNRLVCQDIETQLEHVINMSKGMYSSLVSYPLAALEHQLQMNTLDIRFVILF